MECMCLSACAVEAIAACCPELATLGLNGSCDELVTDAVFPALARGCPALADLDVQDTPGLTDDKIPGFRGFSNLVKLNVSDCSLTYEGWHAFAELRLPRLRFVDISDCLSVTHNGLATLKHAYPEVLFCAEDSGLHREAELWSDDDDG